MRIVPVFLGAIDKVSQVRLYLSQDLRSLERRMAVLKSIQEVKRRFPDGLPILDPIQDLKIKDDEFKRIVKKIKNYEASLEAHILHTDKATPELYNLYIKKIQAHERVDAAKAELRKAKSLLQMDELKCRKRVLRRLGYSAGDDVIQIKGRVACELTSADELLLTEMIFNGVFIDLDVPQTVAVLSCLVCDERSNEVPKLSEDLSGALKMMQDIARQIAKVSKECKMDVDEDLYVEQFKPFLMDVVYEWAKGATFLAISTMTDIFEGNFLNSVLRIKFGRCSFLIFFKRWDYSLHAKIGRTSSSNVTCCQSHR